MNRLLRTLTVLTFAVLQCIAPLVHAHIGGQQSAGAHNTIYPNTANGLDHCIAEQGESATITPPQEYQRDDKLIVSNTLPEFAHPTPKVLVRGPTFTLITHHSSNATLFRSPPAQAPPLLHCITAYS